MPPSLPLRHILGSPPERGWWRRHGGSVWSGLGWFGSAVVVAVSTVLLWQLLFDRSTVGDPFLGLPAPRPVTASGGAGAPPGETWPGADDLFKAVRSEPLDVGGVSPGAGSSGAPPASARPASAGATVPDGGPVTSVTARVAPGPSGSTSTTASVTGSNSNSGPGSPNSGPGSSRSDDDEPTTTASTSPSTVSSGTSGTSGSGSSNPGSDDHESSNSGSGSSNSGSGSSNSGSGSSNSGSDSDDDDQDD